MQKRIKDAGTEPLVCAAVAAPGASDRTKELGQKLLDKLGKVRVCMAGWRKRVMRWCYAHIIGRWAGAGVGNVYRQCD